MTAAFQSKWNPAGLQHQRPQLGLSPGRIAAKPLDFPRFVRYGQPLFRRRTGYFHFPIHEYSIPDTHRIVTQEIFANVIVSGFAVVVRADKTCWTQPATAV